MPDDALTQWAFLDALEQHWDSEEFEQLLTGQALSGFDKLRRSVEKMEVWRARGTLADGADPTALEALRTKVLIDGFREKYPDVERAALSERATSRTA